MPAPRQLRAPLLSPPRQLVASLAAAADDVVDQIRGALAGAGCRTGGRAHRPLDRGANRVRDGFGSRSAPCTGLFGSIAHRLDQDNPRGLPTHLRPTAPIATDVLLPSDPALALTLAQRLLVKPRMTNHSHGLWGYSGATAEGRELTIQATGIGGPSAATVLHELAGHGAKRAIRLGIAIALDPALAAGSRVVVAAARAAGKASGHRSPGPGPDRGAGGPSAGPPADRCQLRPLAAARRRAAAPVPGRGGGGR